MRLYAGIVLATALLIPQTSFPPEGGASGGAAASPITQVDGCVTPGYGFTSDTDQGLCRDDGTGPYATDGVAVQTSDPTDLEYAGFFASEIGAAEHQFQIVAFDSGGADGVLIAGRANGAALDTNLSLDATDGVGGQTGSVNVNMDAPDAGAYALTMTVTDVTGGTACANSQTSFGLGLCSYTFATLPAAANGTIIYCSDCTNAAPCAAAGGGNVAKREGGAWNCD